MFDLRLWDNLRCIMRTRVRLMCSLATVLRPLRRIVAMSDDVLCSSVGCLRLVSVSSLSLFDMIRLSLSRMQCFIHGKF